MAFESLTDRLAGVFKKLRGHGKLTEADIKAAMREVRMALLEADVNYKVAKDFCAKVSERAMGQEVLSLNGSAGIPHDSESQVVPSFAAGAQVFHPVGDAGLPPVSAAGHRSRRLLHARRILFHGRSPFHHAGSHAAHAGL